MVTAGFSFQDDTPAVIQVDIDHMLRKFRERVEEFAKHEHLAEHLVQISKDDDLSAFKALDRGQVSDMSMDFWQPGDWFYDLRGIVPFLTLELAKRKPKNMAALEKAHAYYSKSWRWRPKTLDPYGSTAAKYLSVLKEVRGQLKACQEAAREPLGESSKPIAVGKFELFDSLGVDDHVLEGVKRALSEAGRNMTGMGLGGFCYGKVTVVNSSKLHAQSAAFYVANTDEIYVSPDLGADDVRALCHEIGHRVYFQLNLKRQAENLYQATQQAGNWVTSYAKTNALENFAEVVSFAAIKKLDTNQKAQLQAALPKIHLAGIASRVVRRFLLAKVLPKKGLRSKVAINLGLELPTLWYENEAGDKWLPNLEGNPFDPPPPKGFDYQHSRFPRELSERVLRIITKEDVDTCDHPEILKDHGLIEGLEGRICRFCGGSQTKNVGEPWPAEWNSGGSKDAYSATSTYPTALVLAMTRPTAEEVHKAGLRGHTIIPVDFERAVILAATSCERCLNVLLYRHGCDDGYEEGSPDWQKARTSCALCK